MILNGKITLKYRLSIEYEGANYIAKLYLQYPNKRYKLADFFVRHRLIDLEKILKKERGIEIDAMKINKTINEETNNKKTTKSGLAKVG